MPLLAGCYESTSPIITSRSISRTLQATTRSSPILAYILFVFIICILKALLRPQTNDDRSIPEIPCSHCRVSRHRMEPFKLYIRPRTLIARNHSCCDLPSLASTISSAVIEPVHITRTAKSYARDHYDDADGHSIKSRHTLQASQQIFKHLLFISSTTQRL